MSIQETDIHRALATVQDPASGDPLSTHCLREVRIKGGAVTLSYELGYPARSQEPALQAAIEAAVARVPGVQKVRAHVSSKVQVHGSQRGAAVPGVKNIIAVGSGKGGVGKSTTATNLALALVAEGATVGMLDADIYGPSQPLMLGVQGKPASTDGKTMEPLVGHGIQVNSIGFLVEPDQAMIWRGPMATQALEQLMRQTNWRDLDYLVVDMPPGTGDIHLTLSQRVPVTGAVIVTTPQDIALADARKAVTMFEKVGVPILGLVENMAMHVCSNCGHVEHIFGVDGGRNYAAEKGISYLGALPLALSIREQTDSGNPTVIAEPEGEVAAIYKDIARKVAVRIARQESALPANKLPKIKISAD